MDNNLLLEWIKFEFLIKGKMIPRRSSKKWFIKNNYQKHYNNIIYKTRFIETNSLSEKIYCIIYNIEEVPKCKSETCNNKVGFAAYNVGYSLHCSHKCSTNNESVQEKSHKTCLERYGIEKPCQSKTIREKVKKTCLERYGVENTFQSKEKQEKIKQTCLER